MARSLRHLGAHSSRWHPTNGEGGWSLAGAQSKIALTRVERLEDQRVVIDSSLPLGFNWLIVGPVANESGLDECAEMAHPIADWVRACQRRLQWRRRESRTMSRSLVFDGPS